MGTQLPPKKDTVPPQFSAHVCCGQAAGWMKTPLGIEVDLGPGHIVSDQDPAAPHERGIAALPLFSAHVFCGHGRPSQLLLRFCYYMALCAVCMIFCSFAGICYYLSSACTEYTMAEETNVTNDNSCIAGYIEIVPLVRGRDDSSARRCNKLDYCDEIKQELLQDIKQEPDELHEVCDTKDTFAAADVRSCLSTC